MYKKKNEIVNTFLLAGDKFIPEMHLKQRGFTSVLLLVESKLKNLKTFDSSYFIGKSHFEEDGTQNYLAFQPMYRYFKRTVNSDYILEWKCKRLPDDSKHLPCL